MSNAEGTGTTVATMSVLPTFCTSEPGPEFSTGQLAFDRRETFRSRKIIDALADPVEWCKEHNLLAKRLYIVTSEPTNGLGPILEKLGPHVA